MKQCLVIFLLFSIGASYAQIASTDSLKEYSSKPVTVYDRTYLNKYNNAKVLVLKVYPYALYAADKLDEIENNSESIKRRRKKNKFYRNSYKELKKDFKYVLLDMYTQEGIMLMKLVHRETGMTVYEIAEKYKGKKNAAIFNLMGKLWDQDVKIKFEPEGRDKIIEQVIQDIDNGLIEFDETVHITSKEEFKAENKKNREFKRRNKKELRKNKRDKK